MSVHSYTESYTLYNGKEVAIEINDSVRLYVDGVCQEMKINDFFHLAALFNRAYGYATDPKLAAGQQQ